MGERLHVLATQCQQRADLAPLYQEETFPRLVEWTQSQSHHRGITETNLLHFKQKYKGRMKLYICELNYRYYSVVSQCSCGPVNAHVK